MNVGGTPNTPGPGKYIALGAGLLIGGGVASGLERGLTGPEKARAMREKGDGILDSRQASIYAMGAAFGCAAGITLGLQKRSPTAGLTTSQQVIAAALLSTVAGTVVNATSENAGNAVTGVLVMSAATGLGALAGVRDEVHPGWTRLVGLALFGLAVGASIPTVLDTVSKVPGDLGRSIEHRER